MRQVVPQIMVALTLMLLVLAAPVAFAQEAGEATNAAVDQAPPSGPLIMLLIGILAFAFVGIAWIVRERNALSGNARAYASED